jgi:hypothetical protein
MDAAVRADALDIQVWNPDRAAVLIDNEEHLGTNTAGFLARLEARRLVTVGREPPANRSGVEPLTRL